MAIASRHTHIGAHTHTKTHTRFWLWLVSHMADNIRSVPLGYCEDGYRCRLIERTKRGGMALLPASCKNHVCTTFSHWRYKVSLTLRFCKLCSCWVEGYLNTWCADRYNDENMAPFVFIPEKLPLVNHCQHSETENNWCFLLSIIVFLCFGHFWLIIKGLVCEGFNNLG